MATSTSTTSITGTSGNDTITNTLASATINAGAGNDSILSYGDRVIIYASSGNDRIHNGYYKKDYYLVSRGSSNDTIDGGEGNDFIENYSYNSSINGGFGDDTIKNGSYRISSTVGSGGAADTVEGGAGNDSIDNYAERSLINGGDGDDTINNGKLGVSYSGAVKSTIYGGNGNDDLWNSRDSVTMSGDDGDDVIFNNGNRVSLSGGNGNDTIKNYRTKGDDRSYGYYTTISGGAGNDLISLNGGGCLIQYVAGDGADIIYGFNGDSTLSIVGGTGAYPTTKSGSAIIVTVGNNEITLVGAASLSRLHINDSVTTFYHELDGFSFDSILITGTENGDSIKNSGYNVTINGGEGDDTIQSGYYSYTSSNGNSSHYGGDSAVIDGGAGNDSIKNSGFYSAVDGGEGNDTIDNHGCNVTIKGGDGSDKVYNYAAYSLIDAGNDDDSIVNYFHHVSIDAGAGNDSVFNYSDSATINTGAGDDLISLWGVNNLIEYNSDDGKDVVYGFNETTTLQIAASNYSTKKSGSNIIVTVGTGKITLVGAASLSSANINFDKIEWKLSGTTATYGTALETLVTVNGVKSLDGISLSGTKVTLTEAALGTNNVTISDGYKLALGKNVTKTSKTKAWSLNKTTATYEQTTTAGYTLADNVITYIPKSIETLATIEGVKAVDGLKISGKTIKVSAASLNKKNVTVSDGYTLKLGTDVTKSSKTKAWSLSKTTATYKQTTTAGYTLADNAITYFPKSVETLATVKGVKSLDGLKISGKTITVSEASLNKKNVTVSDGYTLKIGSDVTKPITEKAAWNLSGSTATYKSSYKTAGYTLTDNQISYAKATTATNLATVKGAKSTEGLSVSGNKITLKNAALANKVTVSGGYEFDFAKDYTDATITGSKNNDTITARGTKVLINAGAGDDTIKMLGSSITVKGGTGNDLFVYTAGNNVIADYETGDKISIGAAISKSSVKGSDATFTIGKNALTVKDGFGKEIVFINAEGTERTIIGGAYLADDSSSENSTLAAWREVADATERTKAIKLTGNALDNSILGGSGQDSLYGKDGNDYLVGNAGDDYLSGYKGNDTLWGGIGNDTLTGSNGADVFIYASGDGNDVISDFDNEDMLLITGVFSASYDATKNSIAFKVDSTSNAITLKNFTATTFHINDDTYAISNNKFVKQ